MLRWLIAAAAVCCALSDTHAQSPQIHAMVTTAAASAGVPRSIAHAVVRRESNYNPDLRGRAGEWGLGQIKCQTARGVGFRGPCAALRDPATNLTYAMRYLAHALRKGSSSCAGISLYQRGISARPVCTSYGRQVMALVR